VTGAEPVAVEPRSTSLFGDREVALVDILDRLLAGGVVLTGDITISLAGVDLVRVSLRALVTSIAPASGSRPAEVATEERDALR
jgi:hypothetical protein